MRGQRRVVVAPNCDPYESQSCREKKRGAPAEMQRKKDDAGRGDDGADHAAAIEYADGEGAFALREPLRDYFHSSGEIAAFACSHPEAEEAELKHGSPEGVHGGRDRPREHGEGESGADADTVHEPSDRKLANHH